MSTRPTTSGAVHRLKGDLYTVSAALQDEARRVAARQTARKNLAAGVCRRHGIDPRVDNTSDRSRLLAAAEEFAQLVEMLDL